MKVQITVRGRSYTVRSDEDDLDLRAIAAFVDSRMGEVAGRATAGVDDYTIALLTCLNIASDLERYRREVGSALADVEREVTAAEMMLRATLPDEDGEMAPEPQQS
jgi:cell division protein ZapA (FtsZ GTPase activity inhibitor)